MSRRREEVIVDVIGVICTTLLVGCFVVLVVAGIVGMRWEDRCRELGGEPLDGVCLKPEHIIRVDAE
jgi:hypothetical protein